MNVRKVAAEYHAAKVLQGLIDLCLADANGDEQWKRRNAVAVSVAILKLRMALSLSQEEFAGQVGVGATIVSHWETGIWPDAFGFKKLALLLKRYEPYAPPAKQSLPRPPEKPPQPQPLEHWTMRALITVLREPEKFAGAYEGVKMALWPVIETLGAPVRK